MLQEVHEVQERVLLSLEDAASFVVLFPSFLVL